MITFSSANFSAPRESRICVETAVFVRIICGSFKKFVAVWTIDVLLKRIKFTLKSYNYIVQLTCFDSFLLYEKINPYFLHQKNYTRNTNIKLFRICTPNIQAVKLYYIIKILVALKFFPICQSATPTVLLILKKKIGIYY